MRTKILVAAGVSLLTFIQFVSAQDWEISNQIIGTDNTPYYSVMDDNGNNYVQSQFTGSVTISGLTVNAYGSNDILISKINPDGSIGWLKQIGSIYVDNSSGITLQVEGIDTFIFVTGTFRNTCQFGLNATLDTSITYNPASGTHFDLFLAKYRTDGTLVWAQNLAYGNIIQSSSNLVTDQSNNLIMCGYFRENLTVERGAVDTTITLPLNTWAVFTAKFNSNGGLIWLNHFLISGGSNQTRINNIAVTKYGYLFGGNLEVSLTLDVGTITNNNPGAGIFDAFIYKTNLNGTGESVRKIYGTANDNLTSLAADEYGNYFVLGNYASTNLNVDSTNTTYKPITGNTGGYDTYIAKYNRDMTLQWVVTKGSTASDRYNDIDVKNNVIYATGYFAASIIFNQDTLTTSGTSNPDPFFSAMDDRANAIMGDKITGVGNYNDAGNTVAIDNNMDAHIVGVFRSNSITIGDSTYTNAETGSPDLFYARYQQPFRAALTGMNNVSCIGNDDGMLTVTPYFGNPPYSYSWSHNAGLDDSTATGLAPGSYTVTVTDVLDSITHSTYQITEPSPVAVIFTSVNPTLCYGSTDGSINITASGGNGSYQYNWATGTGGSNVNPVAKDQTGLSPAWYYVTITDYKGCSVDDSAYVNQPSQVGVIVDSILEATFGNTDGAIYMTLTGGTSPYTNRWYGPEGFESTDQDITGLIAGPYELIAEDANNCEIDTALLVTEIGQLVVTVATVKPVTCLGSNDGRVVVQSSCPLTDCYFSYHWEDSLGNDLGVNSNILDSVSGGRYYVTVTEIFSSLTGSNMAIVDEATNPIDPTILSSNPTCYGASTGMINLTVTGGKSPFNFLWSRANETSEDLTNVAANAQYYKVSITDAYGCMAYDSVLIGQPTDIVIGFDDSIPTCPGGNDGYITALPTGGTGTYTYMWSDNGDQTSQMAYDLEAGLYFVTVTDQNNCKKNNSFTLLEPQAVTIDDIRVYDVTCNGLSDGAIKVVASGGHGMYNYAWGHTALNEDTLSSLSGGNYNVTVADFYGCTQATNPGIVLNEPAVISVIDTVIYDVTCNGLDNGAIRIDLSGGTGTYEITWNPSSANSDSIGNLAPGFYDVTITDASNCTPVTLDDISINEPPALTITDTRTYDASCNGNNNGAIRVVASGGIGGYQYTWNPADANSDSISGIGAGTYDVTIADDNNCTATDAGIQVDEPEALVIDSVQAINVTTTGANDGSIIVFASGGTTSYAYILNSNPSQSGNTFASLISGSYYVAVDDANSCGPVATPDSVVISGPNAISDLTVNAFKVYPNPSTNGVFYFECNINKQDINLKVINALGSVVYQNTIKNIGLNNKNTLDLSQLSKGIYYLVIDNAHYQNALIIQ